MSVKDGLMAVGIERPVSELGLAECVQGMISLRVDQDVMMGPGDIQLVEDAGCKWREEFKVIGLQYDDKQAAYYDLYLRLKEIGSRGEKR